MKKRISTLVISMMLFCSIICCTAAFPQNVSAASKTRAEAVAWAESKLGQYLDYDGVYGAQCVDLIKYYYAEFFGVTAVGGNGCDYSWNALPAGWTRVANTPDLIPEPGDIAVWANNGANHVAIITSATLTSFNSIDQNITNAQYPAGVPCPCIRQTHGYGSGFWGIIRPDFVTTGTISFSDQRVDFVDNWNAGIYTKVQNPGKMTISQAGCRLYDSNGTLLKEYSENCGLSTSYVNYTCNFISDMGITLQGGHSYRYQAFVIANGQEYKDSVGSFTTTKPESTGPEITDIQVTDVDATGYTVKCTVTDSSGIDRVQFPTWTAHNDQDDIASDWGNNTAVRGSLDGNTVTFRVEDAAHNYERGTYITHIYAYDIYDNSTCSAIPGVEVKNSTEPVATITNGNNLYQLFDNPVTPDQLSTVCNGANAHPVTITSKEEQNAIAELIKKGKRPSYWIGLSDQEVEGTFKWITGEATSYTNWHTGEPNNQGDEDYVLMYQGDGTWNDASTGYNGYICEIEGGIPAETITLDKSAVQLKVGESIKLTATITPTTATNQSITWTSDKNTIATVNDSGEVKALAPGSATITATAPGGKQASCVVTVVTEKPSDELGISGSISGKGVKPGGIATITVNLDNYDISDKKIASMQIEIPNMTDELSYVTDSRTTIIEDGEFSQNTESLIFAYLPFSEGENILPKTTKGLFTFQVKVNDQIKTDMDVQLPVLITMGDEEDNAIMQEVESYITIPVRQKVVIKGDLNGTGTVDIMDARKAKRAAMKTSTLTEDELEAADLDGDGKVTIIEARKIKRAAMKETTLN